MNFEDRDSPFPCLVINDDRDNLKIKSTTLCIQPSATGVQPLENSQDKTRNIFEWSEETTQSCMDPCSGTISRFRVILLRSPLHDKEVCHGFSLPNQHLGTKGDFRLPSSYFGEICFTTGYWEWTEDVLGHHDEALRRVDIYNAVHASLFTYVCNRNVLRAFLELWCPSTNTLHTCIGELSISLWDLRGLGGLPIHDDFYDEVIPSAKELTSDDFLPQSCKFLFSAFHRLPKESNMVSVDAWIDFWFKGTSRYAKPPPRSSHKRTTKPRMLRNPYGNIDMSRLSRTEAYAEPFVALGIDENLREEAYLVAYLSCWLCKFVLPHQKVDYIRPTVFKVASKLACGGKISLAIPALASIYRGLRNISSSRSLAESNIVFPIHYLYAWTGSYLPTYFGTSRNPEVARMIRFGGENMAKHFEHAEALELFHSVTPSKLRTLFSHQKHQTSVVDEPRISKTYKDIFVALRSSYLTLRVGSEHIVESYTPHRFSRQFGFCQDIPGTLKEEILTCDLHKLVRLWNSCVLLGTESKLIMPGNSSSPPLATNSYVKWWSKCRETCSKQNMKVTVKFKNIAGPSSSLRKSPPLDVTPLQSKPACNFELGHHVKDLTLTCKTSTECRGKNPTILQVTPPRDKRGAQPPLQEFDTLELSNKNHLKRTLKRARSKSPRPSLSKQHDSIMPAVTPVPTPQFVWPEGNEKISALSSSNDGESTQYQLKRRPKVSDLDNISIHSSFFGDVPSSSMPLEEFMSYLANLENQAPTVSEGSVGSVNEPSPFDLICKEVTLELGGEVQQPVSVSKDKPVMSVPSTAIVAQELAIKKLKMTLEAPSFPVAIPEVSEFCPQVIKSEVEQLVLKFTWNRITDKILRTSFEGLPLIKPTVDELVKQMREYTGDTSSLEARLQCFFDDASSYVRVKLSSAQKQSKESYDKTISSAQQSLCEFEAQEIDIIKAAQKLETEVIQLSEEEDALKTRLVEIGKKKEETNTSIHQSEEDLSRIQAKIANQKKEILDVKSIPYWSDRDVEGLNKMEALLVESRQDLTSLDLLH